MSVKTSLPSLFGDNGYDQVGISRDENEQYPIRILPGLLAEDGEPCDGYELEDARQLAANINAACDSYEEHRHLYIEDDTE